MKTIMAFLVVALGIGVGAARADDDRSVFRTLGITISDDRGAVRVAPGYWDDDDDDGRRGWRVIGSGRWDDDDDDGPWDDDDDDDDDDGGRWDDDDD